MFSRLRHYSKTIVCLLVVVLLLFGIGYAQGIDTPAAQLSLADATFVNLILTLLSWIWIPLSTATGYLMTNSMVYGEFINFDIYLWQMWNISKTLANFMIGFIFLVFVGKTIFQKDNNTGSEIANKIGWFLLAGVLIQASWFMMGALLDIEKIATSAMGALPGILIQEDSQRWSHMVNAMSNSQAQGRLIEMRTLDNGAVIVDYSQPASRVIDPEAALAPEITLDAILPRYNTLSGPLYFLGFAMFQFHSYGGMSFSEVNNIQDLSWLLTDVGIKFLIVIAYVIMLLLLFVANIIRIWYLWLVIALAPIIILYLVLKNVIKMDMGNRGWSITDKINIPTIITYIFQPTIIVTFMGLMLVAVVWLWGSMQESTQVIQEYGFTITNDSVEHETFFLETQWDLLSQIQDGSKGVFRDLVMMAMIFALLLGIIVLTGKLLQIKFIQSVTSSLGRTLANIPLAPVWSMGRAGSKILNDTTGINLSSATNRGKLDTTGDNRLRDMLWLDPLPSQQDDAYLQKLDRSTRNPAQYIQTLNQRRNSRDGWLVLLWSNKTPGLAESYVNFLKQNNNRLDRYGLSRIEDALWSNKELTVDNLGDYLIKYRNAQETANILLNKQESTVQNITAQQIKDWYTFQPTNRSNN